MLSTHGELSPAFTTAGFRSLEPPPEEQDKAVRNAARPLAGVLNRDENLRSLLARLMAVRREIREVEIATEVLRLHISAIAIPPGMSP